MCAFVCKIKLKIFKWKILQVYTINNESNHLLVFGVPSLNLRQEAKSLFSKFGKLLQFNLTNHPSELFTETYHATYENIQMARIAKRMLDTKNFYGGSLHICYAPELETIDETRCKLLKRQQDVTYRLINLQKESTKTVKPEKTVETVPNEDKSKKLNMGEINTINYTNDTTPHNHGRLKNKRKMNNEVVIEKRFKPCFVDEKTKNYNANLEIPETLTSKNESTSEVQTNERIEIIDCTSTETETVTNINETLNYNKFGNEIVKKIPEKPLNRIKFNVGNKLI